MLLHLSFTSVPQNGLKFPTSRSATFNIFLSTSDPIFSYDNGDLYHDDLCCDNGDDLYCDGLYHDDDDDDYIRQRIHTANIVFFLDFSSEGLASLKSCVIDRISCDQ